MENLEIKKRGRATRSSVNLTPSGSGLIITASPAASKISDEMVIEASSSESPSSSSNLNSNLEPNSPPLKRKKMAEEQNYRIDSETAEKMLNLMECPVCLEVPRAAPIFSCRNGHLICGSCQPKVKCCPTCRCPDVGIRNGFAEKFVSF